MCSDGGNSRVFVVVIEIVHPSSGPVRSYLCPSSVMCGASRFPRPYGTFHSAARVGWAIGLCLSAHTARGPGESLSSSHAERSALGDTPAGRARRAASATRLRFFLCIHRLFLASLSAESFALDCSCFRLIVCHSHPLVRGTNGKRNAVCTLHDSHCAERPAGPGGVSKN